MGLRHLYYIRRNSNPRRDLIPVNISVTQLPLVDPPKVSLPPLHIKVGLIIEFGSVSDE